MYRALYRKWRPQVFTDVSGQSAVTATLQSEVASNRLSHAYLFTGSRGTGKTTCAKILAKAVNCLNPQDGNPCCVCEICRSIDSGAVLDVTEIDAASNNGVDNIRDLREETSFTPTAAKYRVYIIDEVHMLTIGAFNALLKTLEEPPEYVIFILATTEVHKLPATILSRCQRFDFRRIPAEDIASRLRYVAEAEAISLDEDAALLIARVADGALRDALSLLDQCASKTNEVTLSVVGETVGLLGRDYLFELSDAINAGDGAKALAVVDKLHNSSCDMERLLSELVNHFRNILVAKTAEKPEMFIVCPPDELDKLKRAGQKYAYASLLSITETLCAAGDTLRRSAFQRAQTEALLLRLCIPSLSEDTGAILRRLADLERDVKRYNSGELKSIREGPLPESVPEPEISSDQESCFEPLGVLDSGTKPPALPETPEPEDDGEVPLELYAPEVWVDDKPTPLSDWAEILRELSRTDKILHGALLGSVCEVVDGQAVVKAKNTAFEELNAMPQHTEALREAIFRVTGRRLRPTAYEVFSNGNETEIENPLDTFIKRAKALNVDINIEEGEESQ